MNNTFQHTERPFLAKLYFAHFLRKIGRCDLTSARGYGAQALSLSRSLVQQLNQIIPDWVMHQTFGAPIEMGQRVLDNLPEHAKSNGLQDRVMGKLHIAQAFKHYDLGQGREARFHVLNGLRHDASILANRGVLSVYATSFVKNKQAGTSSIASPVPSLLNERLSASLTRSIEAKVGAGMEKAERLSSSRRVYLIQLGGREYILQILEGGINALRTRLAIAERAQAAGVQIPKVVTSALDLPVAQQDSAWFLEEKATGLGFAPPAMSASDQHSVLAELGRNLRKLHSIGTAAFGRITSDKLEARYASFKAWLESRQNSIANVFLVDDMPESLLQTLDAAYSYLAETFTGPPMLCHCEVTDSNLLVSHGHLNALIDWNSASGSDPAYDIADFFATMSRYWYPKQDQQMVTALLDAYQPEDADAFYSRVMAHRLLCTAIAMTTAIHENAEQYNLMKSFLNDTKVVNLQH